MLLYKETKPNQSKVIIQLQIELEFAEFSKS